MRNIIKLSTTLMIAVLLVLTACSSNDSENASNDDERSSNYPEKEIKLYVPYSAGGSNDTAARILADFMTTHLGTTVVVENKPGAGGVTQTEEFSRAEADGYSLQFSADDPFTTLKTLHDNLSYTEEDFDFLLAPLRTSTVIAVHADSEYDSIETFLDAIANKEEQISFSHPGVGTVPHLSGEVAFNSMGITAQHVPYDGGGQAMNALLGGDVDLQVTPEATILPQVEAGNVRPLAVTSSERSPFVDVPTLEELGYDIDISPVMSVYAPAGLPEDIKQVLVQALNDVIKDPQFIKATEELNLTIDGRSGADIVNYFVEARDMFDEVADLIE